MTTTGTQINIVYLKLSQAAYGGPEYSKVNNCSYNYLEIDISSFQNLKYVDDRLIQTGNNIPHHYKNDKTGFSGDVYEKGNEIVISFRGTERLGLGELENYMDASIPLTKDVWADVGFVSNIAPKQFYDAWNLYQAVRNYATENNKTIKIVGHSLGGGLAQLVAAKAYQVYEVKHQTYTYNAPGVKDLLSDIGLLDSSDYSSFITNYSVMNDWCGMFGEHIGDTFLIQPISLESSNSAGEVYSLFINSHEGIFDYNETVFGKIFAKPEDFNQAEGLSLWYYDVNNVLNREENPLEHLKNLLQGKPGLAKEAINLFVDRVATLITHASHESLKNAIDIINAQDWKPKYQSVGWVLTQHQEEQML